jgi:hypothetical protein
MATFRDKLDREWVIDLTAGDLRRVRVAASVELGKLLTQPDKLADVLFGDREKFGQVLWVLCGSQAEKLFVTEDTFADGLDAPAISLAAVAVLAAVADFTQPPKTAEATKEALRGLMEKADGAMAAEVGKLTPSGSVGN